MEKEAQSEVKHIRTSSVDDSHETHVSGYQRPYKGLRHLQDFEQWLQDKADIETQGIKRVAADERQPPSIWNIFLLWASFNVHAPSLTLGILGAELGLSLRTSVAACMIGIVVGAFLPAFNGTLGPKVTSSSPKLRGSRADFNSSGSARLLQLATLSECEEQGSVL